jgi:hypothetical protein
LRCWLARLRACGKGHRPVSLVTPRSEPGAGQERLADKPLWLELIDGIGAGNVDDYRRLPPEEATGLADSPARRCR